MIATTITYGISPKPCLIEKALAELGPELADAVTVRILWSKKLSPVHQDEFRINDAKVAWIRWYSAEFGGTDGPVHAFVASIVRPGYDVPTFDAWWELVVYDDMLEA